MKKGPLIALIIVIIIIVALVAIWLLYPNNGAQVVTVPPAPTSTTPTVDQSISDGVIQLSYLSPDFGLATNTQQITATSAVPPCDPNFSYCLYYIGTVYQGTNFDSAGIRIEKRTGLTTESTCLNTEPTDYTNLQPTIATSTDYAVSVFSPLGGSAAGHLVTGALYRLYYAPDHACYEFEDRIAQTDFGNYPSGTLQQFTSSDQTALQAEMQEMLGTLTIASSGESISFPM